MKNFIYIILLCPLVLITSKSFSHELINPPSCESVVNQIIYFEIKMHKYYSDLNKNENYELISNDISLDKENLVNWPKFIIKPETKNLIDKKYEKKLSRMKFCKKEKQNRYYYRIDKSCKDGDIQVEKNEFEEAKPKALKTIFRGIEMDYVGIFNQYNLTSKEITKLQNLYKSYPMSYDHNYFCSPNEIQKKILKYQSDLLALEEKGEISKKEASKKIEKFKKNFTISSICTESRIIEKCNFPLNTEIYLLRSTNIK